MNFEIKTGVTPYNNFKESYLHTGSKALVVCHHSGDWTFSRFTSIEKMDIFKTTEEHEINGVVVRFAETTVKGTTSHAGGKVETWTKPSIAYASDQKLTNVWTGDGANAALYIIPVK